MGIKTSSRFDTDALRQAHPIAEVVTGYGISLQPRGRALVGRCPFHSDGGRPNLYVYPDTASWYCYRCALGGDAIEFVRRRENVGFTEACARLANRSPDASRTTQRQPRSGRERCWYRLTLEEQVVMNTACALYQRALWRESKVMTYLRERGIPDWVIRTCGLGYADGRTLEAYLRRRSGLRTAQELGLLRKSRRGDDGRPLREFLAGRIVVPELRGGQCLWFVGRSLGEAASLPKYLSLPGERPVLGFERAAGQRETFLCEGVFDYLTAVAWRLAAFSPCGTSLPSERLGFLARARVVYGVLDADESGRRASERFGAQLGQRFHPLRLPDGCDLNDLAQHPRGREIFLQLLAEDRAARRNEASNGD
jgi:DNA primase